MPKRRPIRDRLMERVYLAESGCWECSGHKTPIGYTYIKEGGRGSKSRGVHRVAYEIFKGAIPPGLEVDHTCWNRSCVNPAHLRLVSRQSNTQNRKGATSRSRSGIRGVSFHSGSKKWVAQAGLNGKKYHLGLFEEIKEAERVAVEWRRKNHPFSLMDQEREES